MNMNIRRMRRRQMNDYFVVVLFQPDHSFDIETGILVTTDRLSYQTELRKFKEANGWDTPFD